MKKRLKLALLLTPAMYMLSMWIIWMSSNSQVGTEEGVIKMLGWGLLISFGISFSVTMYLYDLLAEFSRQKD